MCAQYRETEEVSSARQVIEAAQINVAQLRRAWLQSTSRGAGTDPELHAEFHAAVMEYYLTLRPYRDEGSVAEKWENAILWTDSSGQAVRGFDTLGEWINRQKVVDSDSNSRGSGGQKRSAPDHLPPERLLRISSALDDIAKRMGIGINVDSGPRPAGLLEVTGPDEPDTDAVEVENE